jgi:hypothetical protein
MLVWPNVVMFDQTRPPLARRVLCWLRFHLPRDGRMLARRLEARRS